ncbi:MAG: hypothetical protein WBM58_00080 [Sedimenticolaceae bacterium]
MSRPDDRRKRRSRTQLVLIFALFLLPPVSAWVAWKYLGEQGVGVTTNAGTLVSPARPLQLTGLVQPDGTVFPPDELRGRWAYVMFAPGDCGESCQQQLYLTRQIRLSMSKDIPRVQRLLILAEQPSPELVRQLADKQADLRWVVLGEQADPLLQVFSGTGFAPKGGQLFLVDPLGNLMMYYNLEVPAKGMMRDLQKLLKISQIG